MKDAKCPFCCAEFSHVAVDPYPDVGIGFDPGVFKCGTKATFWRREMLRDDPTVIQSWACKRICALLEQLGRVYVQ